MQRVIYLFLCLFFFSGCGRYYADPSCVGNTSISPGVPWEPGLTLPYLKQPRRHPEEERSVLPTHPLSPHELIGIALANNPLTKQTWVQARASHYALGMEQSACFPTIQLTESLTYTDVTNRGPTRFAVSPSDPSDIVNPEDITALEPGIGAGGISQSWTQTLNFSYLLLDFGGRCADIERAKLALFGSNWDHNRAVQDVILAVLESYYELLHAQTQVAAKKSDLIDAETTLDAAKNLYTTGIGRKLDLLQAEADAVNATLALIEAEGLLSVAYGNLGQALGYPADTPFTVEGLPEELPIDAVRNSLEELMDIAQWQRPDLAIAYSEVCRKRAEYTSVWSESMPSLTTNISLQRSSFFNRPELNGHVYSGSLSLNIPIFNGFLYKNQLRKVREEWRASVAALEESETAAYLDVLTSYTEVETAVEAVQYTERALRVSQEAYAIALNSYREGVGSLLDLLAAQRTLANARAQDSRSRTRWAIALSQLAYAAGTLGLGGPYCA